MKQSAKTISVPEAGRIYFGIEANAAYRAAARGEIPTVQIGRIKRVPIAAVERMLEEAGKSAASPATPKAA